MASSRYDEDLTKNRMYLAIKADFPEVLDEAVQAGWVICLPKTPSLDQVTARYKQVLITYHAHQIKSLVPAYRSLLWWPLLTNVSMSILSLRDLSIIAVSMESMQFDQIEYGPLLEDQHFIMRHILVPTECSDGTQFRSLVDRRVSLKGSSLVVSSPLSLSRY